MEKSRKASENCDIALAIFDISRELDDEDREILDLIKDKNAIIICNKIDLEKRLNLTEIRSLGKPIIEISAKNKEGVENLQKEISKLCHLNEIALDGELIVSNQRHKSHIINAHHHVKKAQEVVDNSLPIDIISSYLKEIIEELGKITGENVTEDVINEIFSRFCLGK